MTSQRVITQLSIPDDPLNDVFTREVKEEWRFAKRNSAGLGERLHILDASDPSPTDICMKNRLKIWRARRAAWETYLSAAFACGFFANNGGKDLRKRLQSANDGQFRSAMAECMTCWVFTGKLGMKVSPYPAGKDKHSLDMMVSHDSYELKIEVKAPILKDESHDNSDVLERRLDDADKQFDRISKNILVILRNSQAAFINIAGKW